MGNDANTKQSKKGDRGSSKKPKKRTTKDIPKGRTKHDPSEDITKYYDITDKVLGMGNFSQVRLGIDKETGTRVALKIVDKSAVKHKPEMLANEVDILLKLDHPNIVKLLDLFDTERYLYLVMELVTGGELFDRIVEREQYSERDAREVMKQLFNAIAYIHSKGIVHRDLKPENLLLETTEDDTTIKLTDFGLSKIYSEHMLQTACGTPGYVAPEILKCHGYTSAIDMWSAGVIMYILLCGYPPFYSENDAELFESIMEANYHFHSPYWDNISAEAKDLIKKLLVPNPEQRLTSEQALNEPWFKMSMEGGKGGVLPPEMKEELQSHNSYRKSKINVASQK
eukprot:TRINITY_DN721_c0_g1_i1.p1 TRINITY_DN721_c0_g1~~TRINITY_DN721_c0_g1_i1.p1  ORF type:complete len:340 (+),score=71.61 TRINITY_DN721_c0_g1_i1:175-1194(+)